MHLDTLSLQIFLSLALTRSFTKTGLRMGRTQSAISQQISRLEQGLGKTLFKREPDLYLTEEGEYFKEHAQQVLNLHAQLLHRFKEPEPEGQIRFGLPEDFSTVFLADVLADFIRVHPKIRLSVACDLTLNLFNGFQQGQFDLVLLKISKPEDCPHGVDIGSERLEWVANKLLLSQLSKSNTEAWPLVLSPQPCVYRARALDALQNAGKKWEVVFTSPSYTGTVAAVTAGLGVTVLPKNMIPAGLMALNQKAWGFPALSKAPVSLLKKNQNNPLVSSFEAAVLKKLKFIRCG